MFDVILSPRADARLAASYHYLQREAPHYAKLWYERISHAILSLDTMPERFAVSEDAVHARYELREMIFGKRRGAYRILYTIRGNVVEVVTIRRATRGPIPDDEF